jgi:hypothetical protein
MSTPDLQTSVNEGEPIERRPGADTRYYGGRRTGLQIDKYELQRRIALEERLLLLARQAILKNRSTREGFGP